MLYGKVEFEKQHEEIEIEPLLRLRVFTLITRRKGSIGDRNKNTAPRDVAAAQ